MTPPQFATTVNGRAVSLTAIPTLSHDVFNREIIAKVALGSRVAAFFGSPGSIASSTELYVVLADDDESELTIARTIVTDRSFPSIAERCPQVHLFEREIAEQFGIVPTGHPWLKPVRYHHSFTGRDAWNRPADTPLSPGLCDFYRIEGEQIHEVAVGPVHAGIIEPGHFRFQCHGEEVYHLEIALGYQHRGIERALLGGPNRRSLYYAEAASGDATIAHTLAYCQNIEALVQCQQSARAQTIRGIALELERLANHVGDLGALAADIGFLPTASFCGRIRGDFLNMTAQLCGSRFGRGLIRPGRVSFDLDEARVDDLLHRLSQAARDTSVAIELLWNSQSVMARLEHVGTVSSATAVELGLVGPAARAAGLMRDVRQNHPAGIYRFAHIPLSTSTSSDVFARAYVRWLEIQRSLTFVTEQLRALPAGDIAVACNTLGEHALSVTLTEGWRGEVCHVAITNDQGRFSRYKIVDPSFHNWMGLAMALRNQQIADFPICNKSFNLSYCGHDL